MGIPLQVFSFQAAPAALGWQTPREGQRRGGFRPTRATRAPTWRPLHGDAPPPERALSLNEANPRPAFGRANQSAFLSRPSLSKPIARRNKRGCRRKRGAGGRLRGARRAGEGRRPGSSVLPPPRVLAGPGRSRGAAAWRPPCGPGLSPGGFAAAPPPSWIGPWPGKGSPPSSCGCGVGAGSTRAEERVLNVPLVRGVVVGGVSPCKANLGLSGSSLCFTH